MSLEATHVTRIGLRGAIGSGMGTGPYIQASFEPGVKSIHKRNENYWREGPNLDAIEITGIADPGARINAVIAGDMDRVVTVEPKAFRQVEAADNVTLLSTPAALTAKPCASAL